MQSADIRFNGKRAGAVEIYYLRQNPKRDEGPFFKEERHLIDMIAERLGKIIERKKSEEQLKEAHKQLRRLSSYLQSVREKERTHMGYAENRFSRHPLFPPL